MTEKTYIECDYCNYTTLGLEKRHWDWCRFCDKDCCGIESCQDTFENEDCPGLKGHKHYSRRERCS